MPHSKFREKTIPLSSSTNICSCGQTFECATEREFKMKLRMHRKFCSNSPKGFDMHKPPGRSFTMEEQH